MMTTQPTDDRLERALSLARSGRTADIRRDLGGALLLYGDARALLEGIEPTPLLANILRWQGSVLRDKGDIEGAEALYLESLSVAEGAGSLAAQAAATNCLAVGAQRRGDLEEATRLYRHAARLATEAGEIRLIGMIEQNLGVVSNIRGEHAEAQTRYQAALRAFEDVGDLEAASWVLNNLGMLFNDLGMPSRAEAAFLRGLALARSRRDRPLEGVLQTNYAEGLIAMRRWDEATEALDRGFEIACESDELIRAAEVLKFRGILERERGRVDAAMQRFREALSVATGVRDRLLMGEILLQRGELHLRTGDADAATDDWSAAIGAFTAAGAAGDAARARERLAELRASSTDAPGEDAAEAGATG